MARDRATPATIAKRRERIAKIALALPEATGATAEGQQHVGFSVRKKRFAWLVHDHHGDGRVALHCKAEPGTNAGLAQAYPDRFHIPAYVGKQGWLGLWVDLPGIDWDEVSLVLCDAYRLAAPARLRAQVDADS
jgi:hypothetical protein